MTDRDLIAGSSSAVEELVRNAMAAGAVCLMEKLAAGEIDRRAPLGESLGDFPAEFIKIRASLVADAVAELAAQRPPLGYVVLGRSTDTVVVMSPRMRPTREDAAEFLAEIQRRIAEDPEWAGTVSSRFIAELREVQP